MATFSSARGTLNFGGAPNMDFSNPAASYTSAYNAANDLNKQLYANQLSGHADRIAQASAAQGEVIGGYRALQKNVMRRLAGSNRANLQDIADKYTTLSGQMSQQMIDRGLGNTTVQQSMQRGVSKDFAAESTRSRNTFAQLQADYLSKIGTSRLQAQQSGNAFLSGLQGDQLSMMERVTAPYPDAGMFASLAAAAGRGGGPGVGQLPTMPGSGGYGGRPIGGYLAHSGSVGGTWSEAAPMSGANLFSGWATGGTGGMASDAVMPGFGGLVSSGYGRDAYGGLIGNEQVGPQLAATGYADIAPLSDTLSGYYGRGEF